MSSQHTVLLLGATGRTGGRVLSQLLGRGVRVRAVVRSAERLPEDTAGDPNLTVVVADLQSSSDEDLIGYVRDCDVVVSCLGHRTNLEGIYGQPRDLVTRALERVCRAIESSQPGRPVKVILMSSVSVNQRQGLDTRRGWIERAALWMVRGLVPPARDNQRAADFLCDVYGAAEPAGRPVQWVIVRPDTLVEGDVTPYSLHETLVSSLSRPDKTTMANVAHFMCELAADPETWATWQGKLPVIVNAAAA